MPVSETPPPHPDSLTIKPEAQYSTLCILILIVSLRKGEITSSEIVISFLFFIYVFFLVEMRDLAGEIAQR